MTGIAGIGAYAPRFRLAVETIEEAWGHTEANGIQHTAVPDADEDALTLAYEAAVRAFAAASLDRDTIAGLFIGTTTPPYEEEAIAPRLVSTLGLPDDMPTRQIEGSTRAGVDALIAARQGMTASDAPTLAIGTDVPRGAPDDAIEQGGGAGAAAILLDPDGEGSIGQPVEHVTPYPGTRFRAAGSSETTGLGVTEYDRNAFRRTVATVGDAIDRDLGSADAIALQSPDGAMPYRAAGDLGVDSATIQAGTTVHELGDTGAAGPLLGVATAIDAGHSAVPVIGYGSGGGATALWIDAGNAPVNTDLDGDTELSYAEYLRLRGEITTGEPEGGGAYVSVPSWRRTIPQRHRLLAGRCPDCEELAFPPEGACTGCGDMVEYESVELSGSATVEAATTIGQGGAPPEFVEQQARSGSYVSAIVAFDGPGDGSVSVPVQVITGDEETIEIGDRLEATIRRIYAQEGVIRYGVKMLPAG
ncbi:MAG: zinc ribbon domain-containing protein [Salinirussus sp.]